jgi:hypothetical protein
MDNEIYNLKRFAKLRSDVLLDLKSNMDEVSVFLRKYPRKTILAALGDPTVASSAEVLREISRFYFAISPHYRRAVIMLATILTNNYVIRPLENVKTVNKEKFEEQYINYALKCARFKFKDINPQIMVRTLVDGIYYGLMIEDKRSFFLKPLQHKYCRLVSVENGVWRFAFDLSYFDTKKTKLMLPSYGKEFERAYLAYKGDGKDNKGDKTMRWFVPRNQICIKFDEEYPFIIPPLAGAFKAIIDLETYQEIQKDGAILDNYKLINYTVETDSDGNPALSYEQIKKYYDQIAGAVPEGIGVAVNPFKAEGITLKDTTNAQKDYTEDATKDLFNNIGISPLLFGLGANPTYKVIELSLIVDATMMMKVLRQIQRVFNVKYQREMSIHDDYLFEIIFLEQNSFNKDEVANRMQKSAMYGVPSKLLYAAALGQEPIDAYGASYLENDILGCSVDIYNRPLISSNTLSNGEVGRPETDTPSENTAQNISNNDDYK